MVLGFMWNSNNEAGSRGLIPNFIPDWHEKLL